MKKCIIVFVISVVSFISFSQEHVLFGERSQHFSELDNTTRIFLDKNGSVYPEAFIPDSILSQSEYSLEEFYRNNSDKYSEINNQYNLSITEFNAEGFESFQQAVISGVLKGIHEKVTEESTIYILIHGFRKPLESINGDTSSQGDYDFIKSQINRHSKSTKNHFIEIYWDGMYLKPERSLKYVFGLGRLFKKEALGNAINVGVGLRKIIPNIKSNAITVFSHSLGAEVAVNLLFNADLKVGLETPSQENVNVYLLAPAISKKPFKKFYDRNSEISFSERDNYNLSIIYNEADFVLSKAMRILGVSIRFSRRYGNTRLGCNCSDEAVKLKNLFLQRFPNSSIQLVHADSFGESHHARDYYGSDEFKALIREMN